MLKPLTWLGRVSLFRLLTLVDVSEESGMATEGMDFDCKMQQLLNSHGAEKQFRGEYQWTSRRGPKVEDGEEKLSLVE